jgi:hypothetical protein
MVSTKTTKRDSKASEAMKRLDTRIFGAQFEFISKEMNETGDGQGKVVRTLLAEAIINRNKK